MGSEAECTAKVKGRTVAGKARLETGVLEFRGPDLRLSIPFKSVNKLTVRGDAIVSSEPPGVSPMSRD